MLQNAQAGLFYQTDKKTAWSGILEGESRTVHHKWGGAKFICDGMISVDAC